MTECGFFDDCSKEGHCQLLACLRKYAIDHSTASSFEKLCRLLAKFAEMLDDDAMIYSELTGPMLEVFKKSLRESTPVQSQSVIRHLL